jgi:hypothetical protein
MTDRAITRVIAIAPVRGAADTLDHVFALADFATDLIVVFGDEARSNEKRVIYRDIFGAIGRARRAVLWMPGPVDWQLAGEVRRAYEAPNVRSASPAKGMLLTPPAPEEQARALHGDVLTELMESGILTEVMRAFKPRLAARVERPALFSLREQGGRAWHEV